MNARKTFARVQKRRYKPSAKRTAAKRTAPPALQSFREPQHDPEHLAINAWSAEGYGRVALWAGIHARSLVGAATIEGMRALDGEPHWWLAHHNDSIVCRPLSGRPAELPPELASLWLTLCALRWDSIALQEIMTGAAHTRLTAVARALIDASYPEHAAAFAGLVNWP